MSGVNARLLRELFDPMLEQKRAVIASLRPIIEKRASQHPIAWWRWTVWLAYAITIRRIEAA